MSYKELHYVSTDREEEWGGPRRYIKVMIHASLSDLRKNATRMGTGNVDFSEAGAVFHPSVQRWYLADRKTGKWVVRDRHYAGMMRLWAGSQRMSEDITHESVHAAAHIWRLDVTNESKNPIVNLGDNCGWREEGFAYLVGNLSGGVHDVVKKLGLV